MRVCWGVVVVGVVMIAACGAPETDGGGESEYESESETESESESESGSGSGTGTGTESESESGSGSGSESGAGAGTGTGAGPGASGGLRVTPGSSGCARSLVRDAAGARVGVAREGDGVVACLDGPDAPAVAAVTTERVDVLSVGRDGCGARYRFTFRHDGVVIATRCGDDGVVVSAETSSGVELDLATLEAGTDVTVPWAGDWDADGRAEWVVRGARDGEVRYLGLFGLREDDAIARSAAWRDE